MRWTMACFVALMACDSGGGTGGTDASDADVALAGTYEVTRHNLSNTGCDDSDPAAVPVAYMALEISGDTLDIFFCTSETSCNPTSEPQFRMTRSGNEWVGEQQTGTLSEQETQNNGTPICFFTFDEASLTDNGDGTIRISRSSYADYGTASNSLSADCDADASDYFGQTCTGKETLRGTKVVSEE